MAMRGATLARVGQRHVKYFREYVSCAVEPPNIVCWSHEGLNAFKPMPVQFSMY